MFAVAALAVLVASSAASAGSLHGKPPGDNGDVKVHSWTTPEDDPRNEPKVCVFYLVGFNFDRVEQVSWEIKSWPPTGNGTTVKSGTLTLDEDGHGRTVDTTLPDGHYKLVWTFKGEHGKAKHKVFWVKCGSTPTDPPTSQPPTSQPPTSQPPTSQPPTSQPPTSQPPTSQPPTSQPPTSQPPTSQPPTSQPPTSQPPTSTGTPTPSRTPTPTPTPTRPGQGDHGTTVTQDWIQWDENPTPAQDEPKPAPTPKPVKTHMPVTG
ncbi:hypothetical protein [Nonomuraea pusilla]|uniref:Uncharacterized protein n=1 Tax=Nonomuraea pusilla TaxID=46177 RepID=A0A1H8EVI1_9ACTN|nr:hypothetical protein [Nonomuraea pusilla]SEN23144.1 hypothetical protein SAMN05660976_07112 [Nonomuraea pusilla]